MSRDYNYIIVYPQSHEHLGLFFDLKGRQNVELFVPKQKQIRSKLVSAIKKLHFSPVLNKYIRLPLKRHWYEEINFIINDDKQYCVIILDAALCTFDISKLNNIFLRKNVRGVLALINSMDAGSVGMAEIKPIIPKVQWDDIYTFDYKDAEKYHFKHLNYCYYSKYDTIAIGNKFDNEIKNTDAYFVGGLKGNREGLILDVVTKLCASRININFNMLVSGTRRLRKNQFEDKINYFSGGWMAYEKIIANMLKSNVIIEILQEGQSGPSLRYYEAVCYNKKLLTNNCNIANLPYYDKRYMRFFSTANEIDIEWLVQKDNVDYFYKGDFSPIFMLDTVLS